MSSDWQNLQTLFHAALSLGVEERADYLARACVGDEELRTEVEALIEASEQQDDILVRPVLSAGLRVLASDKTAELTGEEIGSFKLLQLLGEGGMGHVYLAEDRQLGRKVALKFLSGKWADNQWAKKQFAKEAQAVAMLDHPNICPVHRFEEVNGYSFIVMQYVEGERLDQLIQSRKVGPAEALSIAVKIARALAHAHAHGIIHRDIKPSNIMVSADSELKVLDFGLAKIVQQQQGGLSAAIASNNSLQLGFIPGTVPYMSPEQLRGQRLDYRTDIFSFGVVLYELINGSNPFAHDREAETLQPSSASRSLSSKLSGPRLSRELNRVARKCLENEREARYQSVSELLADLELLQKSVAGKRPHSRSLNVRTVAAVTLLLLLIAIATFAYSYLTRPRTVVILPIANQTGDANLEYLADGLTESFITRLSGLGRLRVKPYSAIYGYKGQQVEPQQVGRELGSDVVIVSKLAGSGESLSLQVVMIDTEDGSELWGDIYKIGLADLFHVEDDVSRQLTSRLELWSRTDQARIKAMQRARSPEAYEQYMYGRYYWRLRDKKNIKQAIDHFSEAIKLDPMYARAYAGLADCYVLLNTVHYGSMSTKEAMMMAEVAAREALLLDDSLAEAHTALGVIYWKRYWNWAAAEQEFKRAIELDPNFAPAHSGYSNLLAITGRVPAAIRESELAYSLDQFSPSANLYYCRTIYFEGDYERAAVCFDKLVKKWPDFPGGQYLQGLIALQRGMYQEATLIFEKLYAQDKSLAGAALGYTYGINGRRADALRVMDELKALKSEDSYLSPQEFAIIYIGMKEKDNAFAWLQKAADEHFAPLAFITVDPLFNPIRSDDRFAGLIRSLNLPYQPSE